MFAGEPQPVEIHHRGVWYSGELIGWRPQPDGRVAARVRCRVDGLRHSAWMDLADLRLPDPERPPHKEPFPAVVRRSGPVVDDPDATRPNVLLAAMRSRPAKPAHAVQPPPAVPAPAPLSPDPVERPSWDERAPAVSRDRRLYRRDAYLTVV